MMLIFLISGKLYKNVTWQLNNKTINTADMIYDLSMQYDNIGTYTCEVTNGVGTIKRTFTVDFEGCILDTRKYFFNENQPIISSPLPSLAWPTFRTVDHNMIIMRGEQFDLHCPKGFLKSMFPSKYVSASCEGGTKVIIDTNLYEFSDVKCAKEPEITIYKNGTRCLPGNTEAVQIGYTLGDHFLKAYEVCVDKTNHIPLYTQHELSAAQYNLSKTITDWHQHIFLPLNFDAVYDCTKQAKDISTNLGKPFHLDDNCCFDKRQLVNPKDLRPGIPPAAANTYLNVVPHWSTCNSKNWIDVEESVRQLAKTFQHPLKISTGTANHPRMGKNSYSNNIKLLDGRGKNQPVTDYLWKVVEDRESAKGVAIIQVNVPDLSAEEVRQYILCKDICDEIYWMRSSNLHNVTNGYTYCCSIPEFESNFNFPSNQFNDGRNGVLAHHYYRRIY